MPASLRLLAMDVCGSSTTWLASNEAVHLEIRLQTLGPPRCYANGALTDLSSQKLRFALLLYLSVQRRAARETVAAMFWPERDGDRARRSLATMLFELRRTLGYDSISPQADPLEVTERVVVDAFEFKKRIDEGDLKSALELYQGEFLEGFHLNNNAFENWLESKRRELKQLYQRAANQHISQLNAAKDFSAAVSASQRWVDLDPLDDEANHTLIQSLANAGKRAEPIAHFETYKKRIKDELDVSPLPETIDLVERLRRGEKRPAIPIRKQPSPEPLREPPPPPPTPVPVDYGFWGELKRRGVLRFGWMYLVVVYIVIEVGQNIFELFTLPKWPIAVVAVIAVVAFPLAIILSWQFDLTGEGIRRTESPVTIGMRFSQANWRIVGAALTVTSAVAVAAFFLPSRDDQGEDVVCAGTICGERSKIESDRFVVLPLSHAAGLESIKLDGRTCAHFLYAGLSHWDSVKVVDQLRVNDALLSVPIENRLELTISDGLRIARHVGAGRAIMGQLWENGDTTRVYARLYNTRSRTMEFALEGRFPTGNVIAAQKEFNRLAQQLVIRATRFRSIRDEAVGTTSWPAAFLYDTAQHAIADWDVSRARTFLERALRRDADFPHANLWLAYVMLWQRDTTESWRHHAGRAAAAEIKLAPHERLLASGVKALAERRPNAACDAYRTLLARDSSSFFGWYGLSFCLFMDNTVVPDANSPSGWSFATSREEAIRAHRRALRLVPSFANVYPNVGSSILAEMLFLYAGRFRQGTLAENETMTFAAWPNLVADTVSLVPYRYAEWSISEPPAGAHAIVAQHQAILADVAYGWAGTYRENPRALIAFARALEMQGTILPDRNSETNSALGVLRRARRFARDTTTAVYAASMEVRLLLKAARYGEARKHAAAAIKKYGRANGDAAASLAGLAGLIGRPHAMAELLRTAARDSMVLIYDTPPATGIDPHIAPQYARTVMPLLAYAALGAPADSLRPVLMRAHEALRLFVPLEERANVHAATLDRAERMLFAALGPSDVHNTPLKAAGVAAWHYMPDLQGMLARSEISALRNALAEIDSFRRTQQAIDYASDLLLNRAELRLAIGDTVAALRTIQPYLDDLRNLRPSDFNHAYQPASIVRLMIMRAELAARRNDRVTARRWAAAAYELWRSGDRELAAQKQRLRYLKGL